MSAQLAGSVRLELTSVGLEGQTSNSTASLYLEQTLGVEPSSDYVGNVVSHHVHPRVWCMP
jgi:hypothetical protein